MAQIDGIAICGGSTAIKGGWRNRESFLMQARADRKTTDKSIEAEFEKSGK
jgi:hypothetical protein